MTRQWPRSFGDRVTGRFPGPQQFRRLWREGGFRGADSPEREVGEVPVRPGPLPVLGPGASSLTWIGHASYLVRTGGRTVLVDPVWSEAIPGRIRRLTPPGLPWADVPPPDVVLITHNHYDHLDSPTVRRLPVATPFVVPAGLGRWFERRGFTDVTELDWWEHSEVAGLDVEFVPAHHWSRRGLRDTNRTLWGGWIVTAPGGPVIYHAGDSGYGPRFAEIGARHPHIDIAILPIGAYDPQWFMGSMHMDPVGAVQAAADVNAARMTWGHWGTFVLSREPMAEPARRTVAAWAAAGRDPADLWELAIGESRTL